MNSHAAKAWVFQFKSLVGTRPDGLDTDYLVDIQYEIM